MAYIFFYFHYQKFSQLAEDIFAIDHHLEEPFIVNIPRLSTPPSTPAATAAAATPATATPAAAATSSVKKRVSTMPTNYKPNIKKRQVLKPTVREATVDELTESADKLGLDKDQGVVFKTITCPILRGKWDV